jgi:hypothetical protein
VAASITWAQAEANPVRMMDHLVAVISLSFDFDPFWCCKWQARCRTLQIGILIYVIFTR